jgi:hypothetical protein
MTESSQGGQGAGEEHREPFVSQGDRPEVRLDPDMPLSELRVRDLRDILWGGMGGKSPHVDKSPSWETLPVTKIIETFDPRIKFIADSLPKHKPEKFEFEPPIPIPPVLGPDPGPLSQVIQAVSGINNQVSQLANQVAELQRRIEG